MQKYRLIDFSKWEIKKRYCIWVSYQKGLKTLDKKLHEKKNNQILDKCQVSKLHVTHSKLKMLM